MQPLVNSELRLLVIGPASPPAGGMATQTEQLCRLLTDEGVEVEFLQTNRMIGGNLIQRVPVARAIIRLLAYLICGWRALARVNVAHVMSNSGWSWQLYSAPILWMGRLRGVPVIVNYRGGGAKDYFEGSGKRVSVSLDHATAIVVPSHFLKSVFSDFGYCASIIPNIVDVGRFYPRDANAKNNATAEFHLVVVRNLESIYGIDIAIQAFSKLHKKNPNTRLSIAGSGPELANLTRLVASLEIAEAVSFLGRLNRAEVAELYRDADIFVNSSRVDNMPNSVLEAMASGVPIVSTRAGGIAYIVEHQKTGRLVNINDADQLAVELIDLCGNPEARTFLSDNASEAVKNYQWSQVKQQWLSLYQRLANDRGYRTSLPKEGGFHLYTRLISNLIFPLQERIKKHHTVALRRSLEMTQWLSPEELEAYRIQRLRDFLSHIGTSSVYYGNLFRGLGFDPSAISSLSDLHKLPLMTKADIRDNTRGLTATDAKGLQRFSTGGSSGNPLIFFLDSERISHDVAAKWRATRWWDVDIGDPEMVVWGSPIELGAQDRIRKLRDQLYRTKLFSAFDMSDKTLANACTQLVEQRPRMVFGYPSVISSIAQFAKKTGVKLSGLGVKVVFVTAERLYPEQRSIIESAFGCRVANGYGGRDSGFIAHECPQGSLHISAEDIIVETVDGAGNPCETGAQGEIVVTHMATENFPFVRYRTGDVGVLSDQHCACGRGLPVLKDIVGRSSDFVVAQDGSKLHGAALTYVLRDLTGIEGFKIVQKDTRLVHIDIVKGSGYKNENESLIVKEFSRRLGKDLECVFDYPGEIAPEPSGKYRYIVCEVEN
tara:strand:- start:27302 stop:29785 length:2484 start_codon:yes stop_codon:yes gene_type:complete